MDNVERERGAIETYRALADERDAMVAAMSPRERAEYEERERALDRYLDPEGKYLDDLIPESLPPIGFHLNTLSTESPKLESSPFFDLRALARQSRPVGYEEDTKEEYKRNARDLVRRKFLGDESAEREIEEIKDSVRAQGVMTPQWPYILSDMAKAQMNIVPELKKYAEERKKRKGAMPLLPAASESVLKKVVDKILPPL